MASKQEIAAWWEQQIVPTIQQRIETLVNSFRHVDDGVPLTDVTGLVAALNDKASKAVVDTLTDKFYNLSTAAFMGYALTSTNPGTPTSQKWYFAKQGTYTNFLNSSAAAIVVPAKSGSLDVLVAILHWTGTAWDSILLTVDLTAINSRVDAVEAVLPTKLTKVFSKNKLNVNDADVILNAFIGSSGTITTGATPSFNLAVSGFIAIGAGQTLKANFATPNVCAMLYDINKQPLTSTVTATGATSITQSGAGVYARFTFYTNIANKQIEVGTVSTSYEPYTEYKPVEDLKVYTDAKIATEVATLNTSISTKIEKRIGRNLFDSTKIDNNKFLNDNGSLSTLNGYFVTDFIPVTPALQLALTNVGTNAGGAKNVYFDANKAVIGFVQSSASSSTPVMPSGCYFVRFTGGNNALLNSVQIEVGSVATAYKPFTEYKPVDDLRDEMIAADTTLQTNINQTSKDILGRVSKVFGKNLFDKTKITDNKFLNNNGITLSDLNGYFVSDFIAITPSTQYSLTNIGNNSGGASNCFYDANKAFVSFVSGGSIGATFTSPSNAYFVRLSGGNNTLLDAVQVEQSSTVTSFEPYTEFKPIEELKAKLYDRPIEVVLPSKMFFVKNQNVGIYFQNILRKNLNDSASVFFNIGQHWENQVQLQFAAAATNQTFTTQVVDNLKKGQLKTISYDVIDGAANNGKTINLFCIGDSFTDIAKWVKELKTLLVANGVTVNQIGTQSNTVSGTKTYMEALSGGKMQNFMLDTTAGVAKIVDVTGMTIMPDVAYPGARYLDANGNEWLVRGGKIDGSGNGKIRVTKFGATNANFTTFPSSGTLTKVESGWIGDAVINYTNATSAYFSPFINPSTGLFDIAYYFTFWGYSNPDVIVIQYTFNDVPLWATDTQLNSLIQNNWKFVADAIHTAFPSCKVIFSVEPWGAINNGGLDWNGRKFSFLRFTELLLVQFEANNAYNTWVKIAPSYAFVDMINGYWNTSSPYLQAPNPRYPDVKEPQSGDGVHPSIGMLQIADCIYPIVSALI